LNFSPGRLYYNSKNERLKRPSFAYLARKPYFSIRKHHKIAGTLFDAFTLL
jgi:hypothetical protein